MILNDKKYAKEYLDLIILNKEIKNEIPNENLMNIYSVEKLDELLSGKKKLTSAPGVDKLSLSTIAKFNLDLKEKFVQMLNAQWQSGSLTELQKTINILPIPKPEKNLHEIKSYRPISLICNPTKIINDEVLEMILQHQRKHNLNVDLSFGFKRGHSTRDCLSYLINEIKYNKRKKLHSCLISLDCEKAFDKVDPEILLNIMRNQHYPDIICNWIYNS
jgi:hypothetical protein